MNFQDVIRSVYDRDQNLLRVSTGSGSSTVFIGTPTLNAVVNTGAATDPNIFIGLTTSVIGSAPTLFAVVNTAAAGQSSVVLDRGHQFIGLTTVVQSSSERSLVGNITLSDAKTFVGLTTSVIGSAPTLFAVVNTAAAGQSSVVLDTGTKFIGLVTVANTVPVTFSGNVTIDSGNVDVTSLPATPAGTNQIGSVTIPHTVNTTILGNLTLSDSKGFIGLSTVVIGNSIAQPVAVQPPASGSLPVNIVGNLTLSDAKTFIGLTTAVIGNTPTVFLGTPTLFAVVNTAAAAQASVVIDRGHNFIGLVTVVQSSSARTITGNVTLSNPNTYIGLTTTTLGVSDRFVGLVTVVQSSAARTITGNVTLSDAKTYVGLVTATLGVGTTYVGLVTNSPVYSVATTFATTISATGNNTIFVAPASNFFVIKDLIVSSLGRGEIKFMEEATNLIPYISLSTTSGFAHNYGDSGLRAGTANKSFVATLNGNATMSVHVNVRFTTTT